MNFNNYQKLTKKTWIKNDKELDTIVLSICEESGEIAGLIKRIYRGDYESEAVSPNKIKFLLNEKDMKAFTDILDNPPKPNKAFKKLMLSPTPWDSVTKELKHEIGDVLYYLARLCDEFGWKFEDIAKLNIDKVYKRLKNNTIRGKGNER